MQVSTGGNLYGFCPGKATWDIEVRAVFDLLIVSAETGNLYNAGGVGDQPEWFMGLLTFFLPLYDRLKFIAKAKMILGDGNNSPKTPKQNMRQSRGR